MLSTPKSLTVSLGARSYPIHFAPLLGINTTPAWMGEKAPRRYQWVTNSTMASLYSDFISNHSATPPIVIPDGEVHKSFANLEVIVSALLKNKLDRKSALIAFGGGVIGDITGFSASIYQRGIPIVQVPTTLLSMVDSSVGGKTAVNHPLGKNMIGAIHQPSAVWIDTAFLRTLPEREYRAGLAEVVKYALLGEIHGMNFLQVLTDNVSAINRGDPSCVSGIIAHSCAMKAGIVERDETEQGERALLNLGHTFGHAIENLTHYTQYLHGEAVAIGMMMATTLSRLLGLISAIDEAKVATLMQALHLPTQYQHDFDSDGALTHAMLSAMSHDKKVADGILRLIVLQRIGKATIHESVPTELIEQAIVMHSVKRYR